MPSAEVSGRFALRLCIVNYNTTWGDVREVLEAAERCRSEGLQELQRFLVDGGSAHVTAKERRRITCVAEAWPGRPWRALPDKGSVNHTVGFVSAWILSRGAWLVIERQDGWLHVRFELRRLKIMRSVKPLAIAR